jgi:hypothetical protein
MPRLDDVATLVGVSMKAALAPVVAEVGTLSKELAAARADLAALQARPPTPGPPGPAGPAGADGKDGAAGAPGPAGAIGKFADSYRDVWDGAKTYAQGDLVTDDGSMWLCKDLTTSDRPGTSAAWKLIVKRGQHGRDTKAR